MFFRIGNRVHIIGDVEKQDVSDLFFGLSQKLLLKNIFIFNKKIRK